MEEEKPNLLYHVKGEETIGKSKIPWEDDIVAQNKEQAIYLLNKANIYIKEIKCKGPTNKTIESTLPQ